MDEEDGLFFQQFHAFNLLGQQEGNTSESEFKKQAQQEALLQWLHLYLFPERELNTFNAAKSTTEKEEIHTSHKNNHEDVVGKMKILSIEKTVPSMRLGMSSEKKRNSDLIHLTGVGIFSSVFEIVFKKKAIGLKLGADTSKKHAVVKECIDGAEAKYHTDIRPGVYILAVNGKVNYRVAIVLTLMLL